MFSTAEEKINKPGLDFLFKKTHLPYVGTVDITSYITDPDLKKLESAIIKNTPAHRQKSFWGDNLAPALVEEQVSLIMGEGIDVTVEINKDAEKIISEWNDEINVKHQTIEDFIRDSYFDNIIDSESLWRIYISHDDIHRVDLQRVSMANVKIEEHPTMGWQRFIQKANIPVKDINRNVFYRSIDSKYEQSVYTETIIPNEPECCIYINLFKTPPVGSVLHLMVYKRWILWFMRKFAEKYWAPFLIAYVGDPKAGYMPTNIDDQNESLSGALEALNKVRDFGAGAFMATTRVDVLDTKTSKNSVYVDYLEYLNKEIAFGVMSSMSLIEGRGREGVSSDIVQQGQLRFIRAKRESYAIKLRKFYADVLLPAYGINDIVSSDIKINFPQLRLDNIHQYLQSVEIAAKIGAVRDAREIRKLLNPIWRNMDDDITDEENKELRDRFMEINAPSRMTGDVPQQRTA